MSGPAFLLAHRIAADRLRRGRLTVFDATNVRREARRSLLRIAARYHLPAVAIVLDLPIEACLTQNRARPERRVARRVIIRQARALESGLRGLAAEGFAEAHRIRSARHAARAGITLVPLPPARPEERGPFDIIGDVHGCARELRALLGRLGYRRRPASGAFQHPGGRRAILLGDLVDRGPRVVEATRIVMRMVAEGTALCVPGNRDDSLIDHLHGVPRPRTPGLARSLSQIGALPKRARRRFVEEFRSFVASLPSHMVLDGGRLVVVHAGIRKEHVGRDSEEVRRFALNGGGARGSDDARPSVRPRWALEYRGRALIVHGHAPVPTPTRLNTTVNIDTGCVYGGGLTALRYPELRTVSVPARRVYYRSHRSGADRCGSPRAPCAASQGSAATARRSSGRSIFPSHLATSRPSPSKRME